MTPEQSNKLIDASGGNKAFALFLGIDTESQRYLSRISQWRKRGIPARVQLQYRERLAALKKSAALRGML